jgi:hypothetical protein
MADVTADALLERIEAATNLAPVGTARRAVPVTVGGTVYTGGIAEVPIEELLFCSPEDVQAMKPAHRSHRSRRLHLAARNGTFSPAEIAALKERGVLPSDV